MWNNGWLLVENSTIAGNVADYGGGGIGNAGTLTLLNSTIADNVVIGIPFNTFWGGGGVFNSDGLTAVNTTIAYNQTGTPGMGGGLLNSVDGVPGAEVILNDTIVALNTDPSGADDVAGQAVSSASSYNLIGTGGSGGLVDQSTDPSHHNLVGIANAGLDPSGLENSGGPTPTIALLSSSPAIDAGSYALAVDPTTGLQLTTDQRGAGFPRSVNGTVDIGAYESSAVSSGPTIYTVNSTGNTGSGSGYSGDLVYVINQANANTNPEGSLIKFSFTTPQTITLTSTLELSEVSGPEVIQGPGASLLTISGGNAIGVFQIDRNATATVSGLTIMDGQWTVATAAAGSSSGAGIDNFGFLAVSGCTIEDSSTAGANAGSGGGMANEATGLLTVTGSTIEGNSAVSGGGTFNDGWMALTGSTIANNSAINQGGGVANDGMFIGTDCLFANNKADSGGGIFDIFELVLANSTVAANQASGAGGGGIDITSARGGLTYVTRNVITSCTIAGNHSVGGGAGIYSGPLYHGASV